MVILLGVQEIAQQCSVGVDLLPRVGESAENVFCHKVGFRIGFN